MAHARFNVYSGNINLGTFRGWEQAARVAKQGSIDHNKTMHIALKFAKDWPCNVGYFTNGELQLGDPKTIVEVIEEWGA